MLHLLIPCCIKYKTEINTLNTMFSVVKKRREFYVFEIYVESLIGTKFWLTVDDNGNPIKGTFEIHDFASEKLETDDICTDSGDDDDDDFVYITPTDYNGHAFIRTNFTAERSKEEPILMLIDLPLREQHAKVVINLKEWDNKRCIDLINTLRNRHPYFLNKENVLKWPLKNDRNIDNELKVDIGVFQSGIKCYISTYTIDKSKAISYHTLDSCSVKDTVINYFDPV